jgi:GT2 family glycosyltransferase
MAFRREVFTQVGLFDLSFGAGAPLKGGEDCEFVARACFGGWSGGFFPGPVVYHHHRRRGRAAVEILRGYDYSRGAYFAKLLIRQRERRRLILKYWYWDTFARCASSSRALSKAWREVCGACRYAVSYAWRPDLQPTLEAPGTAP